jgi:transcriptional regulator with XRE-family HTH domain
MISGAQVRAARALLGWTTRDLAKRAVIGISIVSMMEGADDGLPSTSREHVAAVQATLAAMGIEFLNGDAPGVRLHPKRQRRK